MGILDFARTITPDLGVIPSGMPSLPQQDSGGIFGSIRDYLNQPLEGTNGQAGGMNRLGLLAAAFQDAGNGGRTDLTGDLLKSARQQAAIQRREEANKAVQKAYATGDMNQVRKALTDLAANGGDISHIMEAMQVGQPKYEQVDPTRDTVSIDPLTGERKVISQGVQKPTPNQPFNPDGTPNTAYQDYEKNLRIAGRSSNTNPGNVQSVQPLNDGTLLIVKRDGTTAHVTMDGQVVTGARFDPTTHFNMGAAGAAGKAAGTAAEAFPTVTANFDLINKTLSGFDDPAVKGQAGKSVGIGSYLPTIPGVNSDFRARQGQLQGQAFLQAFNTLRGGGQITEVEGEKATNAITRLQKAQTPTEFYSALRDAKGIFAQLYESARQRASRGAVVPALQGGGVNLPQRPSAPKAPTVSNW